MNKYAYLKAARTVQEALRDSGIFRREQRGDILEQELYRRGQVSYVVLAAGLTPLAAKEYFAGNRARQDALRDYPLRLIRGGVVDLLLCLRPVDEGESLERSEIRTPLVAGDRDLSSVAVLAAHFRFCDLPDNERRLASLRLEYDPEPKGRPIEGWLRPWAARLSENPAHATVHLHINSAEDPAGPGRDGDEGNGDLRFAVGLVNPIRTILSFACWYRSFCWRP